MAKSNGYRSQRLLTRHTQRAQRTQSLVLYLLAVVVAFAAVYGAAHVARRWAHKPAAPASPGYLALVTFGVGEADRQPMAVLVVYRRLGDSASVYVIPRSLLLEGPNGEYVFAGDEMGTKAFQDDLERLVGVPIDTVIDLPYSALEQMAGDQPLWVKPDDAFSLELDGAVRTFKDRFAVKRDGIAALVSAVGKTGADESAVGLAVARAALQVVALQPDDAREALLQGIAQTTNRKSGSIPAKDVLAALVKGGEMMRRIPSRGDISFGQFAYRPDRDAVMSQITRLAPGHRTEFTVLIRNGSGALGIGEAVAESLTVLDVNLLPPTNADTFDHRETEIRTGSAALAVAQQIRGILGSGAVLNDPTLPSTTVMIITGSDLKAKDLQ